MNLIAVEATVTVSDPAARAGLIEASIPFQRGTREDEPGCLVYCFAADPVHDDRIQVYELWESADALDAHFHHPNYFAMRELLMQSGIVIKATSRKLRVDAAAPVYGSDGVATASFD